MENIYDKMALTGRTYHKILRVARTIADMEQSKDLIGRAGYALTNSSKFDLIIQYFIEQGNYNVIEINMALYEFDQNLLGV